ncbi:MAG: MoxR family ATPase [Candidatus Accumulibacter sp.]|uniref:AAA family ATPase n=1 Tax=Accumulibacter sp. TaxID=2053492 RepID=UPI001A44582F|nr:MoxR family ATPase [Accumulibacter sp.]MBL8394086.1 MoxR family ATPase [Accumulibacter sp.]
MSQYIPRKLTRLPADYCFPAEGDVAAYLFSEEAVIAVEVALVTQRPLLVAGPPGCGKSRLAETVAAVLQWNFLHQTITSRSRVEQLTVDVDHLRRLNDAQRAARPEARTKARALERDEEYYNPGIFWWAFNPTSASRRGLPANVGRPRVAARCGGVVRRPDNQPQHTVLLIDEIDKAEPDLPNDLLEPLDRRSFGLPDGRTLTADPAQELLTIITTNRERELPQAFLRRCVSLLLREPERDGLIAIARVHEPKVAPELIERIADRMVELRQQRVDSGQRSPGTSEFLDAVRTCHDLAISVDSEKWQQVERATLLKPMVAQDEPSRRP